MTAAQGDAVEYVTLPREWTDAMWDAFFAVETKERERYKDGLQAAIAAAPKLAPGCGLLVEQAAIALWHRFAPDSQEEWEYETHKADYRLAAEAVLALAAAPPAPVSEDAADARRYRELRKHWISSPHDEDEFIVHGISLKESALDDHVDAAMQEPK